MSRPLSAHQQHVISTVVADPKALMDSTAARAMCGGKGITTFWRWRNDPDETKRFPEPDVVLGSTVYWRRETVTDWLQRQADQLVARRAALKAGAAKAQAARGDSRSLPRHADAADSAGNLNLPARANLGGNVGGAR
jgi:predicted DNA-binding transcriptional regulator AlpA